MNDSNTHTSTTFLTGLKGYAALAIFLIHSGGGGLRTLSSFTNSIVDNGKYGIILFFVISSFTIAMSINRSVHIKHFSYLKYLLRRWLRIFPLFFVFGLLAYFLGGQTYYFEFFNIKNDVWNLLYEISLLNVLFVRHRNNLLGVEWALSVEFFYYLLFPCLYTLFSKIKNWLMISLVLLLTFIMSFYSFSIIRPLFSEDFALLLSRSAFGSFISENILNSSYIRFSDHWGALKYLFTFTAGFSLFFLFSSKKPKKIFLSMSAFSKNLLFLSTLILGFCYVGKMNNNQEIFITIYTCLLIVFSSYRGTLIKILFENPIIVYLGTISYSFYLTHFMILQYVHMFSPIINFFFALIVTVIISSITHHFIERRFTLVIKRVFNI